MMDAPIAGFFDDYRFLSNFYDAPVPFDGLVYPNAECAFQAQKEPQYATLFVRQTAWQAKRNGRRARLRPDWDDVKDDLMYEIVRSKFRHNADLREKLFATGDRELIEENTWNDTYWGVSGGTGENRLGRILMAVRDDLRRYEKG